MSVEWHGGEICWWCDEPIRGHGVTGPGGAPYHRTCARDEQREIANTVTIARAHRNRKNPPKLLPPPRLK